MDKNYTNICLSSHRFIAVLRKFIRIHNVPPKMDEGFRAIFFNSMADPLNKMLNFSFTDFTTVPDPKQIIQSSVVLHTHKNMLTDSIKYLYSAKKLIDAYPEYLLTVSIGSLLDILHPELSDAFSHSTKILGPNSIHYYVLDDCKDESEDFSNFDCKEEFYKVCDWIEKNHIEWTI